MWLKGFCFLWVVLMMVSDISARSNYEMATFAGGCFWCMERAFEKVKGVIEVISGYAGGKIANPTYEIVSSGKSGYVEAVRITYDPNIVSYQKLLNVFWQRIDPTDPGGQLSDRGPQYRTVIFYHNDEQKKIAEKSKQDLETSGIFDRPIKTSIQKATTFYPAEDYHQDFYKKHPVKYNLYRLSSGREAFLEKIWKGKSLPKGKSHRIYKKPDLSQLKQRLTPIQFDVTQRNATEKPFDNAYWDNEREGIYVDIVSGEPLFSSLDQFKSGKGWPSFSKPLEPDHIVERVKRKFLIKRVEVRSKYADSHLGHVFKDGPPPTGLRYCINSAALRFIPKEDLKKEGYGEYLELFVNS